MSSARALGSLMLLLAVPMSSCTSSADTQPSSTTTAASEPASPTPAPDTAIATPPGEPGDAIAIANSSGFACALQRAGTVACWGLNMRGELGQLHREDVIGAILVLGLDDAVALAVGDGTVCAARRNGSVLCWGDGSSGKLGNGSALDHRGFVEVRGVRDATAVVASDFSYCAITPGGPWCWGSPSIFYPVVGLHRDVEEYGPAPLRLEGSIRALYLGRSRSYAYREDGSVLSWGSLHDPVELRGIVEANSQYTGDCLVRDSGLVTCQAEGKDEREILSLRGAHHIFQSDNFVAGILPDGSLAGEAFDPALPPPHFVDAHDLVALTPQHYLYGIRSDGRVFEWESKGESFVPREIELPSPLTLRRTQPAPRVTEAPIPSWCSIETQVVTPEVVESPAERESLCRSVDIHHESSDCPEAGPWFLKHDNWVSLLVPLSAGRVGRISKLGRVRETAAEDWAIDRMEVRSSSPVDAWLMVGEFEAECEGRKKGEECEMSPVQDKHVVVRDLADDAFLVTRATIDWRHDDAESSDPPVVSISGDMIDVWVCGGHARIPLPEGARAAGSSSAVEPSIVEPHADESSSSTPVSAAEAAAGAERCNEGWSKFKAGEFAAAKLDVDAALIVLERAQDDKGRRSLGACLYNRGRIAEQEGKVAEARELYRRSLTVRPNHTVSARLDSLGPE